MAPIGFSTGSLALGDFRLGLQMVHMTPTLAIELSALREQELRPLIEQLDSLDLQRFSYVSVHAPSKLVKLTENEVVDLLAVVTDQDWPVIVHPDIIETPLLWRRLGHLLCIENMDKRKATGRTAAELGAVFESLPEASLCFDIGHARQIDPTMMEARTILEKHGHRLKQLHVSSVTSSSAHEPLSNESMRAFRKVADLIGDDIPIILETPSRGTWLSREVQAAASTFGRASHAIAF